MLYFLDDLQTWFAPCMKIAVAILLLCISRRYFRRTFICVFACICAYFLFFINFYINAKIEENVFECIGSPSRLYDMTMEVCETEGFQKWASANAQQCTCDVNGVSTVRYLCCGKLNTLANKLHSSDTFTDMEKRQYYILVLDRTDDGFVPFGAITSLSELDQSDYQPEKVEVVPKYHFPNWPLYLYQWYHYTFEYYAYDF